MKRIMHAVLIALVLLGLSSAPVYAPQGVEMDVLRFVVIRNPAAKLLAMQVDAVDVWPSHSSPVDLWPLVAEVNGGMNATQVQILEAAGALVTEDAGYHVSYVAYNIRDTDTVQSYYRPEIDYWPLHDVQFRHALIHCYDQADIIPPIYGFTVSPVRSLVPPAQDKYYNPSVPDHPYDPGDPFDTTEYDPVTKTNEDSCAILRYANYTFVDANDNDVVDDADYWECPDGSDMPYMEIWTPLIFDAPKSYRHVREFVSDLRAIGLAATTANGNKGFLNIGRGFNGYLGAVYNMAQFDACLICLDVGRLPSQLYSLLHTTQDCLTNPGRRNAVGVNDPSIDALVETVKFSLDTDEIEIAAELVQEMLYSPEFNLNADNFALSYMMLYSKDHYNAYDVNLEGIVKSPGHGSNNKWTFLNVNWQPGFERVEDVDNDGISETVVIWTLGGNLSSFNPCYATTIYDWEILARSYDGLMNVNPYNHYDIPWLADDWAIIPVGDGMNVTFTLKEGIEWQDGHDFTAYDVEFSLEFLRDYHVPRYAETWESLTNVVVTDDLHLIVQASKAGLDLLYDYSRLGPMLPPQIWDRAWASDAAVLGYIPTVAYNVAPGYTAGPNPPPTNLFGTGPWIFQFYDPYGMYADLWANPNYFMSSVEIHDLKTEMFWQVGDYNRDGIINVIDLTYVAFAFGCIEGLDPCYDEDADFNDDGIVDMRDLYICSSHLMWQKEWP